MSLIEKLVKIRFDNFIKEFDVDINCFDEYSRSNVRKMAWVPLKQKLLTQQNITINVTTFDCYIVIKNMIWRNIIYTKFIDQLWQIHMYYNNFQETLRLQILDADITTLSYNMLINKATTYYAIQFENCVILQTKIINYIMLLDIIVTENIIYDLGSIFKKYIFNVILVL